LPPAGAERRDELKRRADGLEERAETEFADTGAINPKAFAPDRDILSQYDRFDVSKAQDGYVYCWARYRDPGSQVEAKRALAVRTAGGWVPVWELVIGKDMPEAMECLAVDGTRKIGDVLLLRARADRYRLLQQYQEELRYRQQHGVDASIKELGAKHGVTIHSTNQDINNPVMQRALGRAQAKSMAMNRFADKLRDGTAHHVK